MVSHQKLSMVPLQSVDLAIEVLNLPELSLDLQPEA